VYFRPSQLFVNKILYIRVTKQAEHSRQSIVGGVDPADCVQ
jgi:hypothetical protein